MGRSSQVVGRQGGVIPVKYSVTPICEVDDRFGSRGLREDKPAAQVQAEMPAKAAETVPPNPT
jgi:hypothetical protein